MENNKAKIIGFVEENAVFSHENTSGKFYRVLVSAERLSGTKDKIKAIIPERLVEKISEYGKNRLEMSGEFRSYNKYSGEKMHLILYLYVKEVKLAEAENDFNMILLNGKICRINEKRKTPNGKTVADMMVAVDRKRGRSDYIPCILWGSDAERSEIKVGDSVKVSGRMQSREYTKKTKEGEREKRTAYEVSVSRIDLIQEAENEDQD